MADWPYNTTRWQKLRKSKLRSDPLCFACGLRGKVVPARAVDHVEAISQGGDPFPALDGLMSLCLSCHSEKTMATDMPGRTKRERRFKGFDTNGNPIDPVDGWFSRGGRGG